MRGPDNNNKVNTKCKKLKNKINGYDNHQLMDRVIPEISPIQISKCDSVNSVFFLIISQICREIQIFV